MNFREFKDIVAENYKSVFPKSACTIGLGALGKDTFFVTYYLAEDQSEFPNGISQNDLFHISFHIMQKMEKYGDGIKLEDNTELPETLVLDVHQKTIMTKPDNDYMAYGSISLPFRRTVGTPEKIIDTLKRYAEIVKKTLTELYESEKLPTNQHPEIIEFVQSKLGLTESKQLKEDDDDETNWAEEEASEADDRFEQRYMNGGNGYTANRKSESKQVNNMKIKFNKTYNKYQVVTPDGRVLEEFDTKKEATDWASKQKDFVVKKENIEYISQKELDDMPDDYKTTVKDTIDAEVWKGNDRKKVTKLYKDLGYEETDPMVLARDEKLGTVLKPVKVKKDEGLEITGTWEPHPEIGKSYAYRVKHGLGGGTLPDDVKIKKYEELNNGWVIVYLDRPLTYKELDFYDIPSETISMPEIDKFIDYKCMKGESKLQEDDDEVELQDVDSENIIDEETTDEEFDEVIDDFKNASGFYEFVVNDVENDCENYEGETLKDKMIARCDDILEHGCVSGTVGSLIYYSDTIKVFDEYADDIYDLIDSYDPEIFLDNLKVHVNTTEIILNCDTAKNWIVWMAYEDVVFSLSEKLREL